MPQSIESAGVCIVNKITKTLARILRGTSDASNRFVDRCALLYHLGFTNACEATIISLPATVCRRS